MMTEILIIMNEEAEGFGTAINRRNGDKGDLAGGLWGILGTAGRIWEETGRLLREMGRLLWAAGSERGSEVGMERRRMAFTEAVRDYDAMIRRICFGYSRSAEDLEDLYQDVLVNVWQGLGSYRADSSLKTWIYRVALNTCVSSLRRSSRRPVSATLGEVVDVSDDSSEKMRDIKELLECISMLGNIDKAVVMLWLDEYSYEEIASITGLSRGNVATRLHRAKDRLRGIYGIRN